MPNLYQQNRQRIAQKKLETAKKLFLKLDDKLSFGKNLNNQKVKDLENAAREYSLGAKENQYEACVVLYTIFQVDTKKYPALCEELKKLLRMIVAKHFTKKEIFVAKQINMFAPQFVNQKHLQ